ncbi:uncharacterized protein LOC114304634 [Camellia sinensis]|uniref:uncharacterized protein LOC114304634 n=1 Tax=Camellia sinensis TaxID=4442 RepID=UPI001035D306|nr:uncharacterized protein LOC114304634 [Camellia sinensis]
MRKELADKIREVAGLQKTIKKAEAKMKTLSDQAEAAIKAKDEAKEKTDAVDTIKKVLEAKKNEAQIKTAEAQAVLRATLATKVAEIKAADEKAYAERAADVKKDYKKQDEEGEVSKDATPETTSDMPITEKSIAQTLQEIDAKLAAEKAAEKFSQMSFEPQTQPVNNAE